MRPPRFFCTVAAGSPDGKCGQPAVAYRRNWDGPEPTCVAHSNEWRLAGMPITDYDGTPWPSVRAEADGARAERAAVVAWLRQGGPCPRLSMFSTFADDFAAAVERGAHLDYAKSTSPRGGLRGAVLAWDEAEKLSVFAWGKTRDAINQELDAVGGYATTSATTSKGGNSFCRSFHRMGDGYGGAVEREGERYGGTGPHADTVAPHHPDVGDRCHAYDLAQRELDLKTIAARENVERIAVALLKELPATVKPETLALAARALVLSETNNVPIDAVTHAEAP
jgi:hypothetical protein